MRQIATTWLSAGFSVEKAEQQKMSGEGLPVMKPNGEPEMVPVTILVLHRSTPFEAEQLRVAFDEDAKQKLITALSGGVLLAKPSDLHRL